MIERRRVKKERLDTDGEPLVRFLDREGTSWRVYELPYPTLDRRAGRSLVFESDGKIRRVRNYPAEWFDLSPDELEALSWRW